MRALLLVVAWLLATNVAFADLAPPRPGPSHEDNAPRVEDICPGGLECDTLHGTVSPACAATAKARHMVERFSTGGRYGGHAVFCPPNAASAPSASASPAASAPPKKTPDPSATVPPAHASHGCAGCALAPRDSRLGALALALGLAGVFGWIARHRRRA